MAGELQHGPALPNSAQLTQAEYEAVDAHTLNNGVAEDIVKYDGTKFVRVPAGPDGTFLGYSGGVLGPGTPGAAAPVIVSTSIDYFVLVGDDAVIVDTSAGPINIFLPSLFSATKPVTIKKSSSDSNVMTIIPDGVETIDNDADLQTLGATMVAVTLWPTPALNWVVT